VASPRPPDALDAADHPLAVVVDLDERLMAAGAVLTGHWQFSQPYMPRSGLLSAPMEDHIRERPNP